MAQDDSRTQHQAAAPTVPDGIDLDLDDDAEAEAPKLTGLLGRYQIETLLGEGGMGSVYRAHDPKLDRTVALKVIRHARHDLLTEARFRREAKTMAALTHDNVVRVFDVDQEDRQLFIAMEYVEGGDLKHWLGRTRRPWDEVLRVFVKAGRGLQAAHDAGLVHRDFKPANVLMGEDGRVLVTDFGLARVFDPTDTSSESSEGLSGRHVLSDDLTAPGTAMGTFRYMAPEALRGGPANPLTDQYAWCIAVYEGLTGQRREGPVDLAALAVPSWVTDALRRGLEADADDRWPNMAALLKALHPPRRWTWMRVAFGVGAAATVAAVVMSPKQESAHHACQRKTSRLSAALADSRTSMAAMVTPTVPQLENRLGEYAANWADERMTLCTAFASDDAADADVRLRCLETRATEFETLLGALGSSPYKAATAIDAIGALSPVANCRDVNRLRGRFRDPGNPQDDARVAEIRSQLSDVRVLRLTRQLDDALSLAQTALARADDLGFAPLQAEANNTLADVMEIHGDPGGAADVYRTAYFTAEGADYPAAAFSAACDLAGLSTGDPTGTKTANEWSRHARAMLERMPGRDPGDDADLARTNAVIAHEAGELTRVAALLEQVIDYRERTLGESSAQLVDPLFAQVQNDLARSNYSDAKKRLDRIHAIVATQLGDAHPLMAEWYRMTAHISMSEGDLEGAKEAADRSLEIAEAAHGPEHYLVSQQLRVAAHIAHRTGDSRRALALLGRALAIHRARQGGDNAMIADTLSTRGLILLGLGENDAANADQREALEISEYAETSASTKILLYVNAAQVFMQTGSGGEAREVAEKAVALAVASSDDPQLQVSAYWIRGVVALYADDMAQARADLELVNIAWLAGASDLVQAAHSRFLLARALWPDPAQHDRALALAREASALLLTYGPPAAPARQEVEKWLVKHDGDGDTPTVPER
ncbi:MAG: serine/threonine protein kinase [Nannocystaceae bacterium]|nr:serine/threonine protein kinase [Nannocystaceae bacterium]